MPSARIHRILTSAPNDTSGLEQLISTRALEPDKLAALLGKTEGNGCVNDFTRAFSVSLPPPCALGTHGGKPGPYVSCHIHDCRACFDRRGGCEPRPRGGGARRDTVQSCAHPIVVHTPRMCKYASLSFTPVTPPLVVGIETVLGAERLCPSPLPCRQRSLPIFSQPGVRTHLPQILRGPCEGPL